MTDTSSLTALLIVALQDLHAAERLWDERLPTLFEKAGSALETFMRGEIARAARQVMALDTILAELDASSDGEANLWLAGIFDDAERDSETIVTGALRDTALIGAFRKGKQAERVSYETAEALARHLGLEQIASSLSALQSEEAAADETLRQLLLTTVAAIPA